ncbi:uncharacterized protein LOC134237162 [Saccostrea cucullata]|uniref:uncharacterized protein LOC134237162 n=1 Tax=Saccostrea cuccullata TaxID=36930 RepID=UPI002ED65A7F
MEMEGNGERERNRKGRFKKASATTTKNVSTCTDENNNNPEFSDVNNEDPPEQTEENDEIDETFNVFDGRRVVEFSVLVDHLQRGCYLCHTSLDLVDCEKERRYGLASLLYVRCRICDEVTIIPTGKRHNIGQNGQGPFDINTKLAVALTYAGIGESVVSKIFSTLNIPILTPRNLKKRERETVPALETLARNSCDEALQLEVHQSSESGLVLSYDAGWQKRGSGRNYNSLSGHALMIGSKTGKVVGYSVMSKTCRTCDSNKRRTCEKDHDCRSVQEKLVWKFKVNGTSNGSQHHKKY